MMGWPSPPLLLALASIAAARGGDVGKRPHTELAPPTHATTSAVGAATAPIEAPVPPLAAPLRADAVNLQRRRRALNATTTLAFSQLQATFTVPPGVGSSAERPLCVWLWGGGGGGGQNISGHDELLLAAGAGGYTEVRHL